MKYTRTAFQVCGYTGSQEGSLIQPDPIISRNELNAGEVKVLNHFNEAHIQIGDKGNYELTITRVNILAVFAPPPLGGINHK